MRDSSSAHRLPLPASEPTARQVEQIGKLLIPVFQKAVEPDLRDIRDHLSKLEIKIVQSHTRWRVWAGVLVALFSAIVGFATHRNEQAGADVRAAVGAVQRALIESQSP